MGGCEPVGNAACASSLESKPIIGKRSGISEGLPPGACWPTLVRLTPGGVGLCNRRGAGSLVRVGSKAAEIAQKQTRGRRSCGFPLRRRKAVVTPRWKVSRSGAGVIHHLEKTRQFVNHYSFHIMDPTWGHVTIKISGHPPFGAQVILNGHEYVACAGEKAALAFAKEGNCFTRVTEPERLAQIADTFSQPGTTGRLSRVIGDSSSFGGESGLASRPGVGLTDARPPAGDHRDIAGTKPGSSGRIACKLAGWPGTLV